MHHEAESHNQPECNRRPADEGALALAPMKYPAYSGVHLLPYKRSEKSFCTSGLERLRVTNRDKK